MDVCLGHTIFLWSDTCFNLGINTAFLDVRDTYSSCSTVVFSNCKVCINNVALLNPVVVYI